MDLRQRVFVVVAIVCGALTSGLVWKGLHPVPPLAEQQARALGFKSAAESKQTENSYTRALTKGEFNSEEFRTAREALLHGSETQQAMTILELGSLKGVQQHKQVLAILHEVGVNAKTSPLWEASLGKWVRNQQDRTARPLLLASTDPNIVELGKKLPYVK